MACIYGKVKCQHLIDTDSCTVSGLCQNLTTNGILSTPALMRRIDFLERSLDGLVELDFVGEEGVKWLMVFERSEQAGGSYANLSNDKNNIVSMKISA